MSPLLNNKIVKIPIKKSLNNSMQMDELDGHNDESEVTAINLSLKKVSLVQVFKWKKVLKIFYRKKVVRL